MLTFVMFYETHVLDETYPKNFPTHIFIMLLHSYLSGYIKFINMIFCTIIFSGLK